MDVLLWVVAAGFFMQTLDTTIVNTALPAIAMSLNENPLNMQMVVFSYSLMVAVATPLSGWLADKLGTRRIFLTAIVIFCLGSLFCATSNSLFSLVSARALQGLGGSMLLPVGRLSILRNFPKERLLPALGFVMIPALIGPLLGPTLGGWLSEKLSWHWIFLINLPAGLIGSWATAVYMPNDKLQDQQPFDWSGFTLVATAMVAFSFSLSVLDLELPVVLMPALLILSVTLASVYIMHAKKSAGALFPLQLFETRSFSIGILGNLFARLGIGGMPYLLPLLFQTNMGYSPLQSGMMLLPSSIAAIIAKRVVVFLIRRCGYRRILIVNTMLLGTIMACFSLFSKSTPIQVVIAAVFFFGGVNSAQFTAMNTMTLQDLPEKFAAPGNSLFSMIQMLSVGAAVAMTSSVFSLTKLVMGPDNLGLLFSVSFVCVGGITFLSTLMFTRR